MTDDIQEIYLNLISTVFSPNFDGPAIYNILLEIRNSWKAVLPANSMGNVRSLVLLKSNKAEFDTLYVFVPRFDVDVIKRAFSHFNPVYSVLEGRELEGVAYKAGWDSENFVVVRVYFSKGD